MDEGLKVNEIILKDRSEMVSISNINDEKQSKLRVIITEDGKSLNVSYGNRWLLLKDGEVFEYGAFMQEVNGITQSIINDQIEQI